MRSKIIPGWRSKTWWTILLRPSSSILSKSLWKPNHVTLRLIMFLNTGSGFVIRVVRASETQRNFHGQPNINLCKGLVVRVDNHFLALKQTSYAVLVCFSMYGDLKNLADNHILRMWLSAGQPYFHILLRTLHYPWLNVGLILAQRPRRWPSFKLTLG